VERRAVIAVTPQMRVLVAIEATDFRRGIDGLARVVRAELGSDPFSGCVFVFRNRRASAVKLLVYDGRGYWLCQKRLSSGRFRFWPTGHGEQRARALEAHELQVLITGGDFEAVRAAPVWRQLA
jgi:transposase